MLRNPNHLSRRQPNDGDTGLEFVPRLRYVKRPCRIVPLDFVIKIAMHTNWDWDLRMRITMQGNIERHVLHNPYEAYLIHRWRIASCVCNDPTSGQGRGHRILARFDRDDHDAFETIVRSRIDLRMRIGIDRWKLM